MTPKARFPLGNLLRGRLAERILTVLLERGGYRVTRLGVEELFDEIKYLDRDRYLTLDLPDQLCTLPDLLVTDPGITWARLIEVKFRRTFNRETANELQETLTFQRYFWPQSAAVIIIGQPYWPDARFHQDYIRVIPPNETECLRGPRGIDIPAAEADAMYLLWQRLPLPITQDSRSARYPKRHHCRDAPRVAEYPGQDLPVCNREKLQRAAGMLLFVNASAIQASVGLESV